MKIQRKIAALLCCLAFMGTLSFDALSAQAAGCSHELCSVFYDFKGYSYEEDGHYEVYGMTYICVDCGYQYWDDSSLDYEKIGDHEYSGCSLVESTDERDVYVSVCETPECGYELIRIYYK